MPEISLGDAAKRAGVSRPTMWRLVRSGKVSARRNERGAWMLEQSEFARVFPESFEQENSSPNSSGNRDEKAFEQNALQGEIQILREVVVELRADKVMLNERLDRAEQERQKLLQVIETQAEHGRQLTDQRPRRRENVQRIVSRPVPRSSAGLGRASQCQRRARFRDRAHLPLFWGVSRS